MPVLCPSPTYGHCNINGNGSALFKRSVTPTQFPPSTLRDAKAGSAALVNVNIGPQADRPLLTDFFSDIQAWARKWTASSYEQESIGVESIRRLYNVGTASPEVLDRKEYREELVAGVVAYRVMMYTLSEEALVYCEHEMAGEIVRALGMGSCSTCSSEDDDEEEVEGKVDSLTMQKDAYTRIQSHPNYHTWREAKASELASITITKLTGLLLGTVDTSITTSDGDTDEDHHHHQHHHHHHSLHPTLPTTLTNLFIRGFRISLRLRTTTPLSHWHIAWIPPSAPFDIATMVNTAHHLHGNCIARTVERITGCPGNYRVRWGVAPVVVRVREGGDEEGEVVHKGSVCLEQVGNYVGVEREVRRAGSSSSLGSAGSGRSVRSW